MSDIALLLLLLFLLPLPLLLTHPVLDGRPGRRPPDLVSAHSLSELRTNPSDLRNERLLLLALLCSAGPLLLVVADELESARDKSAQLGRGDIVRDRRFSRNDSGGRLRAPRWRHGKKVVARKGKKVVAQEAKGLEPKRLRRTC